MKNKFYITTAIDYVNAAPHIGHAFEKVLADAIARYQRLQNKKVFFLTGTDENAPKNEQAAKKSGVDTKKFVDQNSKLFLNLCKQLNISYDRFIRTTEEEHIKKSQELFLLAHKNGDIYKGKYEGLYCEGCEEFKTEKDLVNGLCPEHNKPPKQLSEESYFFKLSKYQKQIERFIQNYIIPETRKKEITSRLKSEPLKDLSVTRINLDWGITCPIDDKHKIYVWFDALINYISGANGNWPADLHVIGKGINWFHSVIWPGMLFSTKQEMPKKLLVHGYLNLKGAKISKSSGNTIDPIELVKKYSTDSVRYSLLKCSVFEDSDYSEEILQKRHNEELANKLGNLVLRVSTLAEKYGIEKDNSRIGVRTRVSASKKLRGGAEQFAHQKNSLTILNSSKLIKKVEQNFNNYELDKALNEIFAFVDKTNEYIQEKKPWETKNKKIIYETANAIKDAAILLSPFIPETSEKIAKTFNFQLSLEALNSPLKVSKIKKSEILFKKI